jgi:hypothetical protein
MSPRARCEMTSETAEPREAYVWVWLPDGRDPVVAGLLEEASRGGRDTFTYASSYRARPDAISLYEPELPLEPGRIAPRHGVVASCLRDASPDTRGRRVIVNRYARLGVWNQKQVQRAAQTTPASDGRSKRSISRTSRPCVLGPSGADRR